MSIVNKRKKKERVITFKIPKTRVDSVVETFRSPFVDTEEFFTEANKSAERKRIRTQHLKETLSAQKRVRNKTAARFLGMMQHHDAEDDLPAGGFTEGLLLRESRTGLPVYHVRNITDFIKSGFKPKKSTISQYKKVSDYTGLPTGTSLKFSNILPQHLNAIKGEIDVSPLAVFDANAVYQDIINKQLP